MRYLQKLTGAARIWGFDFFENDNQFANRCKPMGLTFVLFPGSKKSRAHTGDPTFLEETSLRKQPFKGPIKKLFPLRKQPFKGRVELHLFPQSLKGSVYMFPRNFKPEAVKQDYYNVQEEQC